MLEKMKNKALNLNLKKSFLFLVIVSVIFAIVSGIVLRQNLSQFGEYGRQQWEERLQAFEQYSQRADEQSQAQEGGQYSHDGRYRNWNYQGWDSKNWNRSYLDNGWAQWGNISTGSRVLMGVLFGAGALLGVAYWLLCMVWAYQKADKMGGNRRLWMLAALFFNLWAIAAMYGYSFIKGTCKSCGKLRNKSERYCSRCGAVYQQECGHCHAFMQKGSKYCPNCGEAIE